MRWRPVAALARRTAPVRGLYPTTAARPGGQGLALTAMTAPGFEVDLPVKAWTWGFLPRDPPSDRSKAPRDNTKTIPGLDAQALGFNLPDEAFPHPSVPLRDDAVTRSLRLIRKAPAIGRPALSRNARQGA